MRIADFTIKELIDIKSEIDSFLNHEFNTLGEEDKNNIRFVLKKVTFLKYLIRQMGDDFRFHALTSDLIYLVSTIKKGEERYYYFNLRSIIEQALRIINNIDSTSTISNTDIMEKTYEMVEEKRVVTNLDVIKDEYNTSCLYVHGNENANLVLAEFYQQCILHNSEIENITQKLRVLVKLLKVIFDLILISQNTYIDAAFHRRKSILKFLIGDQSYLKFEQFRE